MIKFFKQNTDNHFMGRNVFDAIHKTIELEEFLWRIIDTEHFQRLRHLKQVGVNSYVYPSANHSRFEHSIGVCHYAGIFIKLLHDKYPQIVKRFDIVHIQIAALLHDVGHGPFSHLFERAMDRLGKKFDHEIQSVKIANLILRQLSTKYEFPMDIDIKLISALITGDSSYPYLHDRPYMNDLVHNSSSGLDVDKLDYLIRDSYMVGMAVTFNTDRLFKAAVLATNISNSQSTKDFCLAFPEKEKIHILEVFLCRHRLYRTVYTHAVARAVEWMVIDIFALADKFYNFQHLVDTDYLRLTDDMLREIGRSNEPLLQEAREIVRRIDQRQLYKKVMQKMIPESVYSNLLRQKTRDPHFILSHVDPSLLDFPRENVIIDLFKVNCGKGKENPLKFINYVNRENELIPLNIFNMEDVSSIAPKQYEEYVMRIYCKNPEHLESVHVVVKHYWDTELSHKCTGNITDFTPSKKRDGYNTESTNEASPTPLGKKRKIDFDVSE